MSNKSVGSSGEWITFDDAGRLIDGPDGWAYDEKAKKRPRAESFLYLAYQNEIKTDASEWVVCDPKKIEIDASKDHRRAFLRMLLHRCKGNSDHFFEIDVEHAKKKSVTFNIADDINGHYECTFFDTDSIEGKSSQTLYAVTSLRFSLPEVKSLFKFSESMLGGAGGGRPAKGGRPTATNWEEAALEMARRFYVGDLKPSKIVDVERHLANWLAEQNIHPSQTTLREHAKRYFDAFNEWNAE